MDLMSLECNLVRAHCDESYFFPNADSDLGSPFTNPTGSLPAPGAQNFKILDHGLNVLFSTPFTCETWHNFAIVVDWDNLTLAVYYSTGSQPLKLVSQPTKNQGVKAGPDGRGEFHFGVLKVHATIVSTRPLQLTRSRKVALG